MRLTNSALVSKPRADQTARKSTEGFQDKRSQTEMGDCPRVRGSERIQQRRTSFNERQQRPALENENSALREDNRRLRDQADRFADNLVVMPAGCMCQP